MEYFLPTVVFIFGFALANLSIIAVVLVAKFNRLQRMGHAVLIATFTALIVSELEVLPVDRIWWRELSEVLVLVAMGLIWFGFALELRKCPSPTTPARTVLICLDTVVLPLIISLAILADWALIAIPDATGGGYLWVAICVTVLWCSARVWFLAK